MSMVVQLTKQIEQSMVNLQIVTGGTSQSTKELMTSYSELGTRLGRTTLEIAGAANEFLRMGYTGSEATELLTHSMRLSTLGMIDSANATKYLVSAIKGYKVELKDTGKIVDMATALDMKYAVSAGDILEAMSRTAASANMAKVEMSNLMAMMSIVMETSQQSPETVGTAFKTAFARFGNVKVGKVAEGDSDETEGINDIEIALKKIGIQIRTSAGEWRSYQEVLDEVGTRFNSLSDLQKNLVTTAMFGTRQREVGTILLSNYESVKDAVSIADNSEGTAEEKMRVYEQSYEASLKRMTVAWEEFIGKFDISKVFKAVNNGLTSIIKNLSTILIVIGGFAFLNNLPKIAEIASRGVYRLSNYQGGLGGKIKSYGKNWTTQLLGEKELDDKGNVRRDDDGKIIRKPNALQRGSLASYDELLNKEEARLIKEGAVDALSNQAQNASFSLEALAATADKVNVALGGVAPLKK